MAAGTLERDSVVGGVLERGSAGGGVLERGSVVGGALETRFCQWWSLGNETKPGNKVSIFSDPL